MQYRTGLNRFLGSVLTVILTALPSAAGAQDVIELTLDNAVEIAMEGSFRIRQLEMGIERNRQYLKSRQAGLKSRVYMNLKAPEIKAVSDYKWNSTLQKDEIIHEDTQLWQMDLSVRQPVILLGYPTNGYLSLNNKMYRYVQRDGGRDVNFYNRYYLEFEQPFFQPNYLKNNIEDAELDLERRELEYVRDRMWLLNSVADDYYDLFEYTYRNEIYQRKIENLNKVLEVAAAIGQADTNRTMDRVQAEVERANTREDMLRNQSNIRQEASRIKQRLRLSLDDSVFVKTEFPFTPIEVDTEQAIEYGNNLNPLLRMLNIDRRKDEIDLDNTKGWDSFKVEMEMTYGREKQDERYQGIWEEFDNSYSASLNAYVPIWDWGRREARVEAERLGLQQTELRIEENRNEIRSDIIIAVENMLEYQERTRNMMESVKMVQEVTDYSLDQYRNGNLTIQDMLQIVDRQRETEWNFLDAYQGYRRSLIRLMIETFYDYENDISLLEKFRRDG